MITYDYDAIDDALKLMMDKATRIMELTDTQQQKAKDTLVGWTGKTAERYDALCDDLEKDLKANAQFLQDLRSRLSSGSEDMRLQDATSAANMGKG